MPLPKLVDRINWVNDTDPAINDTHLNQMDSELDAIDDRVIAMEGDVEAQAEEAEAWAVGERGGTPVDPTDPTYENNSKHYAGEASDSATAASTSAGAAADSAEDAEAWAVGERSGTPVTSGDPTYENNSKHYAQQSASSAGASADSAEDAEALANGTRGGVPVGPSDPAYENNAKYWRDQAHSIVGDKVDSFNGRTGVVLPQSGDYAFTQLSGVNISSPQNGQVVTYDSLTQQWVNADPTGSIAPQNVSDLSLTPGNAKVTIKWSDPGDTIISGVTICKWAGTKLVMKTGSYPTDVNDGTLVVDNTVLDQYKTSGYEVTGLTNGTTYYFQLFPYSDQGAVNKDSANRVSGTPEANVTITLTLNGAKEDTITVKDSNNQNIGTCVFASGQTSGTITASVPVGYSDAWTFTSSVAKDTTTGTSDYSKTATIDDTPSQTVNVYPATAFYWYGNMIDAAFYHINSSNQYTSGADSDFTVGTNSFTIASTTAGRGKGIYKLTPVDTSGGVTLKGMVSQTAVTNSLAGTLGRATDFFTGTTVVNDDFLTGNTAVSMSLNSHTFTYNGTIYVGMSTYMFVGYSGFVVECKALWLE